MFSNKIQFTEQLNEIKEAEFIVFESDQQETIKILKQQHPKVLIFAKSKEERK